MKANELRIGNYFRTGQGDNYSKVTPNEITALFESESRSWINPIPLTEQWLLDLGFEEQLFVDAEEPCFNRFRLNSFYIERFNNEDYFLSENIEQMIGGFDIKIKYVHTLQNLYFALTGKELKL